MRSKTFGLRTYFRPIAEAWRAGTGEAFLRDYQFTGVPADRAERVLAVGRAFLTVTGLGAVYLDPTEPARLAALTYVVLAAYAVYSLAVLVILHRVRIRRHHTLLLHATDIAWTALLTSISEGPISPFFLFFLFAVVAAAYRWGFRETIVTAGVTTVIFLAQSAIGFMGPWQLAIADGESDLDVIVFRVNYLLLAGFLLGYLGQQEKQLRAEAAALAVAGTQPRIDIGVSGSVGAVANTLLNTFDARVSILVLREAQSGRARLWRLDAPADRTAVPYELTPLAEAEWLFPDPGGVWHGPIEETGASLFRVVQRDAWPLRPAGGEIPAEVRNAVQDARTLTAVNMGLTGEWHGRVYLYDMPSDGSLERRLHLLEAMSAHVAPALTNVLLVQRLHSEVSATERARVARELHDGAIQTLIGVQMTMQAMRRSPPDPADVDRELFLIEGLLQREVASLRRLMDALRPLEIDAGESLDAVLAGVVERFRRDSGIAARFVASGPVFVPGPAALELLRITQEALMNIRKHSGARNALVRLTRGGGTYELSIEDDGIGFAFAGRLTATELDARRLGPAVIKERARLLNAELVLESTPGAGSRVQVRFAEALQ